MKLDIHAFVPGPFQAHGQIEMWREGPIIRLRAQGPFNREAVLGLRRAMVDLLQADPPPAAFGYVLELTGSMITSPESMEEMDRFLEQMAALRQPPQAVAYVVPPEVEARDIMLPLIEAMYRRHGRRFGAFDTLASACDWTQQQLVSGPDAQAPMDSE